MAIPHVLSRSTAQSKEVVVKAMVEGEWKDLPTRDVTFDTHKVNNSIALICFHYYKINKVCPTAWYIYIYIYYTVTL